MGSHPRPPGGIGIIAGAAGAAFAAFYALYTGIPAAAEPSGGLGGTGGLGGAGGASPVGVMMVAVVAVQPALLLAGRWTAHRARGVCLGLALMALGACVAASAGPAAAWLAQPAAGSPAAAEGSPTGGMSGAGMVTWAGLILSGAGFGITVVLSTAWAADAADATAARDDADATDGADDADAAAAGDDADDAEPAGRGRTLGIYGFGAAAGGVLGAPAGLLAASAGGLAGLAAAVTALCTAALLLVLLSRRPPRRQTRARGRLHGGGPDSAGVHPGLHRLHGTAQPRPEGRHHGRAGGCMGPFTQIARPRIGPVTLILLGHVAAISIYAATLSALPALTAARHEIRAAAAASAVADMVFSAPVLAALLQTLLAGGRYAGGRLSDLLGPGRVLSFAVVSLAAGIALLHTAGEWILIALIGLIGTTAGIGQTAALSGLMRSATGQRAVAAMSVLWNTGFDLGLLIGAFAAGSLLR